MVLFLSLLVVSILVRNLKRDIAGYFNAIAALADEEKDEDVDKTGWKLVHADVFRPPQNNPIFFCVFIGTGVQIFLATLVCIYLSALLNPMIGMTLTGIVPFAAAYVEFFFIMTSLWMDQFYYGFGFTLRSCLCTTSCAPRTTIGGGTPSLPQEVLPFTHLSTASSGSALSRHQ